MKTRYLWRFGIACGVTALVLVALHVVTDRNLIGWVLVPTAVWHLVWWAHLEFERDFEREGRKAELTIAIDFFDEINLIERFIEVK